MSEETTISTNSAPQPPVTAVKKPKLSKMKKIIIGVVVFIALIIVVAFYATSGASQASNTFVDNMLKNNSSAAYELFSSEAKKTVTTEQFQQIVAKLAGVLDDQASKQSANVESGTGQQTKGTVIYEIKGTDGTYELTVNLVKENDAWKVISFDNSRKE